MCVCVCVITCEVNPLELVRPSTPTSNIAQTPLTRNITNALAMRHQHYTHEENLR